MLEKRMLASPDGQISLTDPDPLYGHLITTYE